MMEAMPNDPRRQKKVRRTQDDSIDLTYRCQDRVSEERAREGTGVIFRLPWPAATAMLGAIATVIPE
jgi:hypothetical protein